MDRVPVIIGVGEVVDRDGAAAPREPVALMAQALAAADADAGGGWLDRLESLDIVNSVSWPYADLPGELARHLGRRPARLHYGAVGGETPVRFLHEAALRIARGECSVAAICGGEAKHAADRAARRGEVLPWGARAPGWTDPRRRDYLHPLARAHGLSEPVYVYPLYEVACQAAWGQTPREGNAESARLWAQLSRIAEANPHAFIRRRHSAAEIATVSGGNRMVAWPYPKLQVANPSVNQGMGLLVTTRALALAAGIPEARMVFPLAGAGAQEPRDWVSRDVYFRSPAQDAVLDAALARSGVAAEALDAVELYSCFPCVPKMARRALAMAADAPISVAGGLTFFGAPLNAYMGHAAAAMVRRLRAAPGATGLLYGQGEFVTKHHALVLSSAPGRAFDEGEMSVQDEADRRRGAVPAIVAEASETATVETFTILYDRTGAVLRGVAVLRLPDGARTLARVRADDGASLAALTDLERSPVGLAGSLRKADDGLLEWSHAADGGQGR